MLSASLFRLVRPACACLVATALSVWGGACADELRPPPEKSRPVRDCGRTEAGGPEEVVQAIYAQYPWGSNKFIEREPGKVLARFFDERLTRLILKYQKCDYTKARCPNHPEIWNDGSLDSQVVTNLRVCAMDADKKTVRVQFQNDGSQQTVAYKLGITSAGWRVSDIVFAVENSPEAQEQSGEWSMVESFSEVLEQ